MSLGPPCLPWPRGKAWERWLCLLGRALGDCVPQTPGRTLSLRLPEQVVNIDTMPAPPPFFPAQPGPCDDCRDRETDGSEQREGDRGTGDLLRAPGDRGGRAKGSPGGVSQAGLAGPSSSPAKLLGLPWLGSQPYKGTCCWLFPSPSWWIPHNEATPGASASGHAVH